MIYVLKYQQGYLFASTLKPKNITEVVRNPPRNFEELLHPDVYKERVNAH